MKSKQSPCVGPIEPLTARPCAAARRRARFGLALALALLALGLFLVLPGLAAAGDGALDPSFTPGLGVTKIPILRGESDWLNSGGTATNGVSLIYGYFNHIADSSHTYTFNSLAKMNDNLGTIDANFHFPINGPDGTGVGDVRFAFLGDPKTSTCDIIIGGSFSLVASDLTTYYNLARLKYNSGTWVVDTTFPHIFSQGGLVWTMALKGTYQASGTYILVGGYDLQLPGDTTNAYQLIRLRMYSGDYIYDTTYTTKHTPGAIVSGIQYRPTDSQWPNAAFIFGTFPDADGSVHWVEVLSSADLSTVVEILGSNQFDGPIYNMVAMGASPYQRIFVGSFQNALFGGTTTSLGRIAQVSADLTALVDTNSFNTNIHNLTGANHAVQQIIMQGGLPVIAGNFTSFNGTGYGHLVRLNLNGTVDTSFNYTSGSPNAGADDRIFRVYQPTGQPTTQILGSFQTYNGIANPRHCIANLNGSTGAINSDYAGVTPTTTGAAAIGTVYAIDEIWGNDGGTNYWNYLVIGGDFTGVNGKFNQNLAVLNLDGTLPDHNGGSVEGPVRAIRSLNDGSALVAGNFGYLLGLGCTGLAHLNSDFSPDYTIRPVITKTNGTAADLRMTDTEDSGKIDIGGNFAYIADSAHALQPRSAFARLNSDGSLDSSFNAQISIPSSSNICVNAGGSMTGGNYGMIGYYLYNNTSGAGFGCVLDASGIQLKYMLFDGEVLCATGLSKNGDIVLGGLFTQVLFPVVASRGHIAAITSSFDLDSSIFAGAGANGPIQAMTTEGDNDNGNVLIGGSFSTYNGVGRNNVARLYRTGALDSTFNPGSGPNDRVKAIRWTNWGTNGRNSGKAYLGGYFTTYNGTPMAGIAQVFASMGGSPAPYLLLLLGD